MLRITVREGMIPGGKQIRLFLEGRIIGPWVSELEEAWKVTQSRFGKSTPIQVELNSVTYISQPGAALLCRMGLEGAELTASTPLTSTYLEEIRCSGAGRLVAKALTKEHNGGSLRKDGMKRKQDSESKHSADELSRPPHQDIAARAHEIWIEGGCEDGKHEEHWLQAEKELRSRSKKGILG